MQFSDTSSSKNGILQRAEDWCGKDFGDVTGDSDELARFTNYANDAMDDIWALIFENYGGWQFDDDNQTDLPIASQNLSNSTAKYAIPADAVTIKDVEIKQDDGEWRQVEPLTEELISDIEAEDEFQETDGTPLYYKIVGETIELFPAPDYTKTNGLKVYFDRGMTDFATSDTSKEPGFAGPFHILVAWKTALQWREINTSDESTTERLRTKIAKKEKKLERFYNDRWQDDKPPQMKVNSVVSQNI